MYQMRFHRTASSVESMFYSNKADIAVNVANVAKHNYVNIRMKVQFTQSRYCCKCAIVAKHDHVNNLIQD